MGLEIVPVSGSFATEQWPTVGLVTAIERRHTMDGQAKAAVDGVIDTMKFLDDRLLLVERDLWEAFIEETGTQPEPINGNDERILYRAVELRPSGAL